ncbi:PD-(D/E)XK nuclease family protein [Treponema denticola]|uniref:PD-(D/E)XK nuclease family protein n=1 Tax=Treponema denticola TaxID=158 RepID=UPI0020A294CE|nr:PD-(D/E)XK nuclease family protein [Treponema denticola]UTC96379.1 PD-(D/E)XK nuclease family protein [Treponema denticola]
MKSLSTYSKEKHKKYLEYKLIEESTFCIFDNFSPKYYYEKLHSEILKTLLDKNTLNIENSEFLNIFLKCLLIRIDFQFSKNVSIYLEYPINPTVPSEAIDILIKDEEKALIIENKINFASDQENQLVRYMQFVEEDLGIEDYFVVYLTLIPGKEPPISRYSKEFEKYKNRLLTTDILKILCAVESDDKKNSLVNYFLPECEEIINNKIKQVGYKDNLLLTKIYINQYKILLNKLGGYAAMESTNKALAKEIFEKKDLIEASNDFIEFWENRYSALFELIYETVSKEIKVQKPNPSEKWFSYEITDNCRIYFECDERYSIGFTAKWKKWSMAELNKLTKILDEYVTDKTDVFYGENIRETNKWTWTAYAVNENITLSSLKTFIIQTFNDLTKKVKE